MDGIERAPRAAEAPVSTGPESGGGAVALLAYNLWAWPFLAINTGFTLTDGFARSVAGDSSRAFDSAVARWAKRNASWGGYRFRVDGTPPEGGAVVVSNHRSLFDIQAVFAVVPKPVRFVARSGILRVPIVGTVLRRGGHIVVDREGESSNDLALARAASLARSGHRISFFPEGTRSRDGRIGPFRGGAFRVAAAAEVPVVPLVLAGTHGAFDRLGGPIRPATIAARYLPARPVTPAQAADLHWREALRSEMAETLEKIAPGTGPRF